MLPPFEELKEWLNSFDMEKEICIDVETISFSNTVKALYPYKGCRISTYIIGQEGKGIKTIPIRHRTEKQLYDIDEVNTFLRQWITKVRFYMNHNPKFDMRFMAQDKVFFARDCKVADTQVLARLIRSDLGMLNLSFLCKYFNIETPKSDAAKDWIKANNTEDYGAIPHYILLPYGIRDVEATLALYSVLTKLLPEETKEQWEYECYFTRELFECEQNGLKINKRLLQMKRIDLIQKIIVSTKKIYEITGTDTFNPKSHVQVDRFFREQGIDPLKYNDEDKDAASWDKKVLVLINKITHGEKAAAMAEEIIKLNEYSIQESTFCAGWCDHADEDDVVHSDFRQAGTRTGRLSCGDPNAQNFPEWMESALLIPEGYVGIKWDLSQIEYRKFTHYSDNKRLLASYEADPNTDYHQLLADVLGFPRKPTKTINFALLYGMGKKKTIYSLAKAIVDSDSAKVRQALTKFCIADDPLAEFPAPIREDQLTAIAENILAYYHEQLPEIKSLNKKIKQLLQARGWVKNYYGRRIYLPYDKAYIGLNAIIQGGSADLFKRIIVKNHRAHPTVKLVDNIHDCDMSMMKIEEAQPYWDTCQQTLKSFNYKVPILMDGKVALRNWSNTQEIKEGMTINEALKLLSSKG
jgi:DNA polymerase I-like protein with 3'-5' exonuclease and polymerase domains